MSLSATVVDNVVGAKLNVKKTKNTTRYIHILFTRMCHLQKNKCVEYVKVLKTKEEPAANYNK